MGYNNIPASQKELQTVPEMCHVWLFSVQSTPNRPWFASGVVRHIKLPPGLYRLFFFFSWFFSVRCTDQGWLLFSGRSKPVFFFFYFFLSTSRILFCSVLFCVCVCVCVCVCLCLSVSVCPLITPSFVLWRFYFLSLFFCLCLPAGLFLSVGGLATDWRIHWRWPAMQIALEIVLCSVGQYTSFTWHEYVSLSLVPVPIHTLPSRCSEPPGLVFPFFFSIIPCQC